MIDNGIEFIHFSSIDNILIKLADPLFIGWHITQNADLSFKIIETEDESENVGLHAMFLDNSIGVLGLINRIH